MATNEVTINVFDTTLPVLIVPSDQTVEATGPEGALGTFQATAGDIADPAPSVACIPPSGSTFPLGTTTVACTATDVSGNSSQGSFEITVQDTTPPVINAVNAVPKTLWPPNHQMVPVSISAVVADAVDAAPSCQSLSIASSEPEDGLGSGDRAPDWTLGGSLAVELRSERSGLGDGRVYTVTVQCTDYSGNSSTGTVQVTVPHDNRTD